jgi:hypothetical protein
MRLTRKTIVALSVSGAMTVLAGVSASAAVLDLPILGFGEPASEAAAPPRVVHRTVYDDHYVTTPTTPRAQAAAAPRTTSGTSAPATTGAAAPAPAPAPTTAGFVAAAQPAPSPQPASTPAPAPTTAPPSDDTPVVSPGGTRPPPPAGCNEPEWDSEHQVWHCSTEGHDD